MGGEVGGRSMNKWVGGAVPGRNRGGKVKRAASCKRVHHFVKEHISRDIKFTCDK